MESKKRLVVVLTLCFLARMSLFVAVRPWAPDVTADVILKLDAGGYHELAVTLYKYHQFANEENGPRQALRTPLYPAVVGFIYMLFGERPWVVLLFQVLLDTLSCLFLFLIVTRMANVESAFYTCIFYALDPFLILHSNKLYSDILFVFLLTVSFYFFSCILSGNSRFRCKTSIAISATALGMAILTRPIAQYVPLLFVLAMVVILRRNIRSVVQYTLIAVLFLSIAVLPWLYRNYVSFGSLSLSTSGDFNLLVLNAAPIEAERVGHQSVKDVKELLLAEARSLVVQDGRSPEDLNPFELARYQRKVAIKYLKQMPLSVVRHSLSGIFRLFMGLSTGDYGTILQISPKESSFEAPLYPNLLDLVRQWFLHRTLEEKVLGLYSITYLVTTYALLILGLYVAWVRGDRRFAVICVGMVLYFSILTGAAGRPRLKLPLIPFYLGFAGIGLQSLLSSIRNRSRKS